jgi:hypothetical protein
MFAKSLVLVFSIVLLSLGAKADTPQAVPMLKAQILQLAKSYQGQADPDGSKKRSFDGLISKLLELTPQKTTAEKASNAVGAWHQIWGPYDKNSSAKKSSVLDPKSIYQVIAPNGFYTNVGVYHLGSLKVIGILKGKYQVDADQISIQFVENGLLWQKLPAGYTLADLPALHDQNKIKVLDFPASWPPVGIKGSLHEIYSDETLRLTVGVQEGQAGETLYVLERVPTQN